MASNNPVVNMFKIKDIRNKIFFTLLILAVVRLGSILTVPGINAHLLLQYFENYAKGAESAFANYMDFFAGGAFEKFSVLMLGVMPYISTQIILQLALIIFPTLKRIVSDDGGQQKFATWTRIGTVLVCLVQSLAITVYAESIDQQLNGVISINNPVYFKFIAMLTVTTGSMVTVWLGDQITSHGIGNGVSVIIFAGIIARMPSAVWELVKKVKNGEINPVFVIVVLLMFIAIVALVVIEQSGERQIPVKFAKRVQGRKQYAEQSTYIPFKINPSGVIPIIFASSFLTFPLQIANSLAGKATWLGKVSAFLNPMGIWYNIILVLLIVFFAYFYTQVTLNPVDIAKNIRENGGVIPGRRSDEVESYLQKVLNRLILPGSLYLAALAILPTVIQLAFKFPPSISMLMGGTSLLIVVGVVLDTMSQVEAQLKIHHHDGFGTGKKAKARNI